MIGENDGPRPRRLWLTALLYIVLLAVVAADIWAGAFWAAVGGAFGLAVAAAAGVVILLLGGLLVADVRRQRRLTAMRDRWSEAARPTPAGRVPAGSLPD